MPTAEIVSVAKNIFKSIHYNFCITKNIPIDTRFIIEDIANINTEIPIKRRYSGLIFWAETQQKIYIFEKDLTTPRLLVDFISGATINQIVYIAQDYGTLLAKLTSTQPKAGVIINIEPIKVAFIYDGTSWRYLTGDYHFDSIADFENFDTAFKQPNAVVLIGNDRYIINSDKTLSTEVITVDALPDVVQNNRYYLYRDILHFAINGRIHSVGKNIKLLVNQKLMNNSVIAHNFGSPYTRAYFRIKSKNPSIDNYFIDLSVKNVDDNSILLEVNAEVDGDLILISNI